MNKNIQISANNVIKETTRMDMLKDLYNKFYIQGQVHVEMEELPEVMEADKGLNAWADILNHKDYVELHDTAMGLCDAYSMQGWIHGYMIATQMLNACGIKNDTMPDRQDLVPEAYKAGKQKCKDSFNSLGHVDMLLKVEGVLADTYILCDGLRSSVYQMDKEQYANTAMGAFGMLARELGDSYELLSEAEESFRKFYGLEYGTAAGIVKPAYESITQNSCAN